jgi:hypothetical protein
MIQKIDAFALVFCAVCLLPNHSASQEIRTVMVLGNDICVRSTKGQTMHLTDDGVPKALPVWSKDGTHIAFLENTENLVVQTKLVVIDQNGRVASKVPIKPYSPGEAQSGMRYVEALEWLTADRIAVSGTVNPSTTEYDIVDLNDNSVINQFFDDGHGAAFSPDGEHYAYVSGSPHFTPTDERAPSFIVDGKPVFSGRGNDLEFRNTPQWSEDSKAVAVPAVRQRIEQCVVVWRRGATRASTLSIPFSPGSRTSIFWSDENLCATTESMPPPSASKVWKFSRGGGLGSWAPVEALDVLKVVAKAQANREKLKIAIQTVGGRDADFWCEACDLTMLPRRSGYNYQ